MSPGGLPLCRPWPHGGSAPARHALGKLPPWPPKLLWSGCRRTALCAKLWPCPATPAAVHTCDHQALLVKWCSFAKQGGGGASPCTLLSSPQPCCTTCCLMPAGSAIPVSLRCQVMHVAFCCLVWRWPVGAAGGWVGGGRAEGVLADSSGAHVPFIISTAVATCQDQRPPATLAVSSPASLTQKPHTLLSVHFDEAMLPIARPASELLLASRTSSLRVLLPRRSRAGKQ